ncbi:ATP-binding protein [Shewanella youngdeokensis]|uniref:ATP-binding protein n=1 Tax=Shewanella youngdeokensis TaxID=2999068 RepID=A0ABZ0K1D1_9GAMM|nr:ATP-binding protein [Shewanella sp. DAU334]
MNSLQIKLNNTVLAEQSLCQQIEQFMLYNSISSSHRFKIVTCVLEAVANVMQHTNDKDAEMILILHNRDNKVIIDLLDNSPLHNSQTPDKCPDIYCESGRGLWIMENWMDSVKVKQSATGTHLQLSLSTL